MTTTHIQQYTTEENRISFLLMSLLIVTIVFLFVATGERDYKEHTFPVSDINLPTVSPIIDLPNFVIGD